MPSITIQNRNSDSVSASKSLLSLSVPKTATITKQITSNGIPKIVASRFAASYCRRAEELANHINTVYSNMINQLEIVGPSKLPVEAYIKVFESAFYCTLNQWMEKSLAKMKERAEERLKETDSMTFSQVSFSNNQILAYYSDG